MSGRLRTLAVSVLAATASLLLAGASPALSQTGGGPLPGDLKGKGVVDLARKGVAVTDDLL